MWLAEPSLAYGDEADDRAVADIAKAVMRYRWATPDDGRRFLGWMVAAIIGGALEWRPHLLLTAPAAQGKTWLLKERAGTDHGADADLAYRTPRPPRLRK